ncbi:MAG TPA: hypothetical protein VI893_11180 [Thermoplasmata archaeon]|nr:hypothetical protein [Thermoplasmata archaeon]
MVRRGLPVERSEDRTTATFAGRQSVARSIMRSWLIKGNHLVDDGVRGVVDVSGRLMNQLKGSRTGSSATSPNAPASHVPGAGSPRFCIMCGTRVADVQCATCGFDRRTAGPVASPPLPPEPSAWKDATGSVWDDLEEPIERDEEVVVSRFPGFPAV